MLRFRAASSFFFFFFSFSILTRNDDTIIRYIIKLSRGRLFPRRKSQPQFTRLSLLSETESGWEQLAVKLAEPIDSLAIQSMVYRAGDQVRFESLLSAFQLNQSRPIPPPVRGSSRRPRSLSPILLTFKPELISPVQLSVILSFNKRPDLSAPRKEKEEERPRRTVSLPTFPFKIRAMDRRGG